ncbi:protein disulfide-isomerase, putative [Bodo saltans]|uniref:Protein disulfide-isomerase, putative n=1 Tax=Bodo saltans TaxID=75058 RepID=A0A0S4JP35_BODSA|nr:protein disulfide-isomerase, putative [Bodo saltans]|eukprot:CUG90265.1 protein disulfide-isomerase, putative [Bodo saltans]
MQLTFTATLLIASLFVISSSWAKVHQLNEETFEHDTQAASGATTGNWFVMFKSEGCRHCRDALPTFEALADEPSEIPLNFAVVDCDDSQWVCTRFGVNSYPSFLLLSRGQMYPYKGQRTTAAFKSFVEGDYQGDFGVPVPPVQTGMEKALSYITVSLDDLDIIREHAPWLYYTMAGAVMLMGVMILLLISLLISQRVDAAAANNKKKQQQKAAAKPAVAAKKKQ